MSYLKIRILLKKQNQKQTPKHQSSLRDNVYSVLPYCVSQLTDTVTKFATYKEERIALAHSFRDSIPWVVDLLLLALQLPTSQCLGSKRKR
jgi:hypothetical protein